MKILRGLLFIFLLSLARGEECDPQAAAKTIFETEVEFVAKGQAEGSRTASLVYLADDAIMFEPGPVNARKVWEGRTDESALSLRWEPAFAAMARSCDLGFTTGPAEWRRKKEDEKPLGHGQYISVWQRQKDGSWKVVLDVGGAVPSAQKVEEPPVIAISATPAAETAAAAAKELREAEKWFATTAKTDSTSAIIGSSVETIRVHREGSFPALGRQPASLMLSVRRGKQTQKRLGGAMSEGLDLAYSYGEYTLDLPTREERGYYLHIWQTNEKGEWKLLLDYQTPLAPEVKKIGE